jgi:hypothetical protein
LDEDHDRAESVIPNRKLLWTSGITFGAAYLPAVVVAITSSNDADRYLYIPLAGPWLDLAKRQCVEPAAVHCPDATLHGVGLFVDGLVQLAGLASFVLAFEIPEKRWIPPARPALFPNGGIGVVVTLERSQQTGVAW